MKANFNGFRKFVFLSILISLFIVKQGFGQIKILPLGNSITWGKAHKAGPESGEHGYRDHLSQKLVNAGYDIYFVGPQEDGDYDGEWHDGATIEKYIPDADFPSYNPEIQPQPTNPYDIEVTLDNLRMAGEFPDVVLLHIGTNDISSDQPVAAGNRVSLYDELNLLMRALLDYNTGGESINNIFLCKIIPRAPFDEYPGLNAKTLDYNSKIDILYDEFNALDQSRVTIVNMHSAFYSDQNTYYGPDSGPVLSDHDHIHPNEEGYLKMADVFDQYIENELSPTIHDSFTGAAGVPLNNSSDWEASHEIVYYNIEGGLYSYDPAAQWENLAIWNKTLGKNSITFGYHEESKGTTEITSGAGLIVALDTTDFEIANGYLLYAKDGTIRIHEVVNGEVQPGYLATKPFTNPSNGDSINVTYVITEAKTSFNIKLMGSHEAEAKFDITSYKNVELYPDRSYYSGLAFRGGDGTDLLLDFVSAKTSYEDIDRPGQTTILAISKSSSSITLQWTAVGDDGVTGKASHYDLRYSTEPITAGNFENAVIVPDAPEPADCGDGINRPVQSVTVKGLLAGNKYYFSMRTIDAWGNSSKLSTPIFEETDERVMKPVTFESTSNFEAGWSYDLDEYKINTETGELYNDQTGGWGGIAVYKKYTNPVEVKLVWGDNLEDPGAGEIANGGFVVLADDSTETANGYLIFIRNRLDVIYLYRIDNGVVADPSSSLLDVVPLDINNLDDLYPGAGDTLAVIIDKSNEHYNRFDIFVRKNEAMSSWKSASRFALYDYDKFFGNVEDNYAGIMLTQQQGVKNNNVAAFLTSFERANAESITAMSITVFEPDTVNRQLSDSLVVEVRDENKNELSEWPIFFNVASGNGSISSGLTNQERLYIEAEWYTSIQNPMIEIDDQSASGGKYIKSAERTPANNGYAEYKIYIETAGTYVLWGRTKWGGSYLKREYRIKFNDEEFTWRVQQNKGATGDWEWDVVRVGTGNPFSRNLSKGMHTLKILTQHPDVPLDRLLLTRETGYISIPDNEPTGAVLTNKDGIAHVKWTLGKTADDKSTENVNEGLNSIIARPFGTQASVSFEAEGIPDVPSSLGKKNDEQVGNAGERLSLPFSITLLDIFQNKVAGHTVDFEIVNSLDGSLSETNVLTDNKGEASTYLTLGYQDTLYEVNASFSGYFGDDIIFKGRVKEGSGLVGYLEPIKLQADQKLYINEIFKDVLQVRVLDDKDPPNPIRNTPVSFEVIKGGAHVASSKYYTDSKGIAKGDITMGSTPEQVQVIARTSLHSDTVLIDTSFYKIYQLKLPQTSGKNQVAKAGTEYSQPIKIYAEGPDGKPAGGIPIIFETNGHEFVFREGGEVALDTTDNLEGTALIYVKAGIYHGVYHDIVQASATDGFYPVKDSPKKVSLYVSSDADQLVIIEGDSLSGVVGETVGPLKVKMMDSDGYSVPHQPLTYKVTAGDGYFGGETPKDSLTMMTDIHGMAVVWFNLGPQVGAYNNEVTVYFDNAYNHREVKYHFSAVVSAADTMAAASPLEFDGVVGKPVNIKVEVFDDTPACNPVKEVTVSFLVISGNGTLNEYGDTTTTVATDDNGKAAIDWILGNKAGKDNNILKVYATNGVDTLNGAPLYFYASASPDSVSPDSSIIKADPLIQASGLDTSEVVITLYDRFKNPIAGKEVEIRVEPSERIHIYGPNQATDENGITTASIVSYSAGEKIIYAKVKGDNLQLNKTDTVTVTATKAEIISKYKPDIYDGQSGNVSTVLLKPLIVKVTDANYNNKESVPVTFQVTGGGGIIIEEQPVVSNEEGLAQCHLILGAQPGGNTVKATADVSIGTPLNFEAMAEENDAYRMENITQISLTGKAGEKLPDTLFVRAVDNKSKPVYGVLITFNVRGGGEVSPQSMTTDEYGIAWTIFTVGDMSGTFNYIDAENSNLAGSPVEFKVFVTSGLARDINYIDTADKTKIGYLGSNVQIDVEVLDKFGNEVGSVPVNFEIKYGDAAMDGAQSYIDSTNSRGNASVSVKLGESVEPVILFAVNKQLRGSPLKFTIYPQSDQASNMYIVRGNNQKGTVGHILPEPLIICLADQYGNPVSGTSVTFSKESGKGDIIGAQPVISDSNGFAMIYFTAGNTTGTSTIKAVSMKEVTFTVEAVENDYFPIISNKQELLDGSPYDEVKENTPWPLILAIYGSDNDTEDILSFQAYQKGYAELPDGAEIKRNNETTATFEWTPNYNQAGLYSIVIKLTDGKGGFDTVTLPIEVENNNRIPVIGSTLPISRDTSVTAGDEIMFWVDVNDPDMDELTFKWTVDNQTVQNNNFLVYYYRINKNFSGSQKVRVQVSDDGGESYVSEFNWTLEVITTSIELASFLAQFDKFANCIEVNWSTCTEQSNQGFDVLRSISQNGVYRKINNEIISAKENSNYYFIDNDVHAGVTYYYKIVDIDKYGGRNEHGPIMVKVLAPDRYILSQNYPNPFNPVTKIYFQVARSEEINLSIFNMMGQKIKTLYSGLKYPGYYEVEWDGKNSAGVEVSTGIYIYRLRTEKESLIKRMVKLK